MPLLLLGPPLALAGDTSRWSDYMDRYAEINALAPRVDKVAAVHNLVLRRDAAEIALLQGTLYLLTPVGGRTVGAVFRGAAKIKLTPPHAAEQEALRRLVGSSTLDDSLDEVIMIFSDSTALQLQALPFGAGEMPRGVADDVRD